MTFAVLASQIIGIKAMTAEDTIASMWHFYNGKGIATSWSSSTTKSIWIIYTSNSILVETQTDQEPETLLLEENVRFQDINKDQEAELFHLQTQCTTQEEELANMIDKINYIQYDLKEMEEDLKKT